MNKRHLTAALLGAGLAVAGVASPAAASSGSSPAQACRDSGNTIHGQPLLGSAPGEGYFAKVGGCASSVAHGVLTGDVAALTTQAGYVQTCQAIEPDWSGLAAEASMITGTTVTINSLPQCVTVLRTVHLVAGG